MNQQYRSILAILLSGLILIGWTYFFPQQKEVNLTVKPTVKNQSIELLPRNEVISSQNSQRVSFKNSHVKGSINLIGPSIDDLELLHYKTDNGSNVVLLSPDNTKESYNVNLSWSSSDSCPTKNAIWTSDKSEITVNDPVSLSWTDEVGTKFIIQLTLDDQYLFDVKYLIDSERSMEYHSTIKIDRSRGESQGENMILHEGVASVSNNKFEEITFDDIKKKKNISISSNTNSCLDWVGFSDKYWLVAVLSQGEENGYKNRACSLNGYSIKGIEKGDRYELAIQGPVTQASTVDHFKIYVGAKTLEILERYSDLHNVKMLDHAVDFGILYFITKPIFVLLNYLYKMVGNFGVAIMLLTIIVKLALSPLAYKSFLSMEKMKKLQPEIVRLKKTHEKRPELFQKALITLYKKEKVNPVSGCLPIILQIPVFFALYKVLYVTIEMRHAPFFGWITDLSAADPTTLFNLFGLIKWSPPSFLMVGVLPILMSISMFVQQTISPKPADETQALVLQLMPVVLLFVFASFPSGLLLYWIWSNIFSIVQQLVIKRITN